MVKAQGGRPVYVDTDQKNSFKITEASLKSAITKKTKAFILNSPSNPTGSVYGPEDLRIVASLAVKNDFYVISDEIYEKLIYGGKRHVSVASLGKEIFDRTIVVNGVSKSYSMTGWRIGYAAGGVDVMNAISNLQSHATSNPASISQKAALAALLSDQACVEGMRVEFERRRDYMVERINSIRGISCVKPDGAFYVFCDISGLGMGSVELSNRLLDEALVAAVPGAGFGADGFVRFSFATGMEKIKQGLDRLESWIGNLKG
jgi:aspartate aminotransferase